MTMLAWMMGAGCVAAAQALALTLVNLGRYQLSPRAGATSAAPGAAASGGAGLSAGGGGGGGELPTLAVCIPARNEEANIEACVRSLLASDYPREKLRVVVYDDQSTDRTPEILARLAAEDPRLVRCPTHPLPAGWNGKQHACWRMSAATDARWMLFTDADVRFERDALPRAIGWALAHPRAEKLGLVSTFPRQVTGSLGEALTVPTIFFLLMGYLPIGRMRSSLDPAASAACGQFLLARRDAYEASGGHQAFQDSMHDGVKMPRAVRRAGFATDIFDGTDLCSVRMYRGWGQSWRGFAKNAYEGLGSVPLLLFLTVWHALGHLLPAVVLLWALASVLPGVGPAVREALDTPGTLPTLLAGAALVMGLTTRAALASRFRLPVSTIVLHPVSVMVMTAIQWHSFVLHISGRRSWRGRVAGEGAAPPAPAAGG